MNLDDPRIAALQPLVRRVRTDVTARKNAAGGSLWTTDPLTAERLARHMNGGPARGVALIKPGESTTFGGLLDFDSHKGRVTWPEMSAAVGRVLDVLTLALSAEPIAFRSSGGSGVHVYVLWEFPQEARDVRRWLWRALDLAGLKPGVGGVERGEVEVFPKQDSVPVGGFGNQAILPFAGRSEWLEWEPLSGMLVPASRGFTAADWLDSPPVPHSEVEVREQVSPERLADVQALKAPLAWIADGLNLGGTAQPRDQWRQCVFGVQAAGGASTEAYELARWFSESTPGFDEFEFEKLWASGDPTRAGGVGAGSIRWLARESGWVDPSEMPNPDDFQVVGAGGTGVSSGGGSGGVDSAGVERGSVPKAQHLCTDQANANRLVKAYGSRVLVAAGRWHVWDGVRWKPDDADVYRYACRLSAMCKEEAAAARRKGKAAMEADGSGAHVERAEKIAEALEKWGTRSESKGTIEAAIGLARKMLTVDAGLLDRDGMLLNVLNGVVDLRDGSLREHRADDYITKLAPVEYRGMGEAARCERWEQALREIVGGDEAMVGFLQRWFGYCATGSVREQVFVVHWGDGSNGKSTVLDTVADVLGDYAGVAAPGLVASTEKTERHPTEIAALMGKRMVTASETREGVQLREDFVKQATGDRKMTARFMREDFFEFNVTHKIQLLTTAKPVVRGQDHGIWRRVRLVAYRERFGSVEEVRDGLATRVKDVGLLAALGAGADGKDADEAQAGREARSGVLGWLVAGAVSWWRDGGLREPSTVIEAGEAYRFEQDRVRQFIGECCELRRDVFEPLSAGMGGLFPAYTEWCREGNYHPLARNRFMHEVERIVPGFRLDSAKIAGDEGKGRKTVTRVWGLRLLAE